MKIKEKNKLTLIDDEKKNEKIIGGYTDNPNSDKEKIDRENENDKVMKIIDSNDETEVDKFLKEQTKHIYSSKYNKENQKLFHFPLSKEL